ncbi:hypothetical protein HanRHA438_Chr09g0393791 [Helianthus annuus]|nr:hypothetical protein HanRHA438_Chr09g0393791 [Helianthus annuus]
MVSACEYYDRYLSGLDYGVWWVGLGHELTRGLGGQTWAGPHSTRYGGAGVWGRGFGGLRWADLLGYFNIF